MIENYKLKSNMKENSITLSLPLVNELGMNEAILIGALCKIRDESKIVKGYWFRASYELLEDYTKMSERTLRNILNTLVVIKAIASKKIDGIVHYAINNDLLNEIIVNAKITVIEEPTGKNCNYEYEKRYQIDTQSAKIAKDKNTDLDDSVNQVDGKGKVLYTGTIKDAHNKEHVVEVYEEF